MPQPRRARLVVDLTPEELKYLKAAALHEDLTMKELLLQSVKERIGSPHTPNELTRKVLEGVSPEGDIADVGTIEDFRKLLNDVWDEED